MLSRQAPKLYISVVGCELVGLLGTPFTVNSIKDWYVYLEKPFFAPPNWLFAPAWTLLYFLMGMAVYLIWRQCWERPAVKAAIKVFLAQLVLNILWSPMFFGLRSPELGLINIVAMWIMIVLTMRSFYPLSKLAFYLLVPYIAWVSFATLLNASIVVLN